MHASNSAHDNTRNADARKNASPAMGGTDSGGKSRLPFPVVGVGASAGGLNAFKTLFDSLPDEPELAFVLIQHLDPYYESELVSILQNHTKMPVAQVEDHEEICVNCVYVIPPRQKHFH